MIGRAHVRGVFGVVVLVALATPAAAAMQDAVERPLTHDDCDGGPEPDWMAEGIRAWEKEEGGH